jgi:transposase
VAAPITISINGVPSEHAAPSSTTTGANAARPASSLARSQLKQSKRPEDAVGFTIVPKRWIVERTIAWLNRCRRLAKDWECLNRKALAFLRLASIRLMLRKLCNPA